MINWSEVAPALVELFKSIALDAATEPSPNWTPQWKGAPQQFVDPNVAKTLTLRVSTIVDVGNERRNNVVSVPGPTEDDPPHDELHESIVGHRKFTLEVRVESDVHTEDANRWCWSMIERIRTRLNRRRSEDALKAVNVSLLFTSPSTDASFKFDKRTVNAAIMDVTFYAAFSDTDAVDINWFESVLLTSRVKDVGHTGDQIVPPTLTFTDKQIPDA